MAKEYMVGTVDDKPLLMVTYKGTKYFVDEKKSKVFLDEKGLPKVTDKDIISAVLALGGTK